MSILSRIKAFGTSSNESPVIIIINWNLLISSIWSKYLINIKAVRLFSLSDILSMWSAFHSLLSQVKKVFVIVVS